MCKECTRYSSLDQDRQKGLLKLLKIYLDKSRSRSCVRFVIPGWFCISTLSGVHFVLKIDTMYTVYKHKYPFFYNFMDDNNKSLIGRAEWDDGMIQFGKI